MADNVTTDDLEVALQDLAEQMGLSVKEYVEGGFLDLTTYGQDMASVVSRLDAIDVVDSEDDIESLAEKIIAVNKVLSDDDGALQGILDLINVNKADIAGLVTTTDGLRTDVNTAIAKGNSNETALNDYKSVANDRMTEIEGSATDLAGRVTDTEASINTLESNVTVEGSVAYSVEQEALRAKNVSGALADLATTEKGSLVGAINEVEADGIANKDAIAILNGGTDVEGSVAKAVEDATGGDISDLKGRVEAEETESTRVATILDDTTDEDDNLVKGIVTKVADTANALAVETQARIDAMTAQLADLKAYSDARDLKAASMDMCTIGNKFRSALGLGDSSCDGDGDGETV